MRADFPPAPQTEAFPQARKEAAQTNSTKWLA